MNRNTWILAGVAGTAFLIFLLLGGGGKSSSTGGGGGILGLFRGGQEGASGSLAARDAGTGEVAPGALAVGGGRWPGAGRRSTQRKAKNDAPPDPELVKRMRAGGEGLVPVGPAESPRAGLLQQSFRGGASPSFGSNETVVAEGGGDGGAGPPSERPDASPDRKKCSPKVRKKVINLGVNLQANGPMLRAFNVQCNSTLIDLGMGQRFSIGGAPACLVLNPMTHGAGAAAIFDDQFLVLIQGQCIPNQQYVKALLQK